MNLKEKWLYNLKIHYIWTFFSSFLFLAPIITLYYQYYGLDVKDIVMLSSISVLISTILEIPTSSLWDTIWRVKVMKMSVLFTLFSFFLIFVYPNIYIFYVAIFFNALWQALWSGTWHAKLQEDLEASEKQKEFWKVIWQLIALENIGKLFTPVVIYFVLKYFSNGYNILAWLDVLAYSIWVFFVFKFIEFDNVKKYKNYKHFIKDQINTIKIWVKFLFTNKTIVTFMILMILWDDLWYLAKVLMPSLVENGVESFLSAYLVWFSVLAWILGNLIPQKLWDKFSWEKTFVSLILINAILHLLAYFYVNNSLILSIIFIFISFVIWIYGPSWNHIIMKLTNIKEKATTRSIFLMIIGIFEFLFLFVLSFVSLKTWLLFLSILMFIWFFYGLIYKK